MIQDILNSSIDVQINLECENFKKWELKKYLKSIVHFDQDYQGLYHHQGNEAFCFLFVWSVLASHTNPRIIG